MSRFVIWRRAEKSEQILGGCAWVYERSFEVSQCNLSESTEGDYRFLIIVALFVTFFERYLGILDAIRQTTDHTEDGPYRGWLDESNNQHKLPGLAVKVISLWRTVRKYF